MSHDEHGAEAPEVEEVVAGETKADAFKRLGNKRVKAALDKIRLVGNLSNRSSYEYTDEQVAKIEDTLMQEVSRVINKFRRHTDDGPKFEL